MRIEQVGSFRLPGMLALAICLVPTTVFGEETGQTAAASGLTVADWIIIAIYALGTLALGWHLGRKQANTKEYFTGSGGMNSFLIGVSLFATLLSTISYLSLPGEAIGKGPAFVVNLIGYPIVYALVAYWLLPVYMKHRVTSAYELLEQNLGRGTRLLGGAMFILLRLVWMSILIYFAASALAIIFGVDETWEPLIVLFAGTIAVGYTSLGGLRAVVITDAIQTVLLYTGAVLVIGMVTWHMGGFGWFPTQWHPEWDRQPVMSFDPAVRMSLVGVLLSMIVWMVATYGGDQVSVQRFMATKDLKAARKSIGVNLIVGTIVSLTLLLAGFALLGFYDANPNDLGDKLSLKGNADKIFPHFIATGLPPIVTGLVVAAICAAAMSSIDSGINSITAVVLSDFSSTTRTGKETDEDEERRRFRRARILAVLIGAIIIATSTLVKFVPGNILAITNKTVNLLPPHIFALFVFALFVRNARQQGVWLGCAAGTIVAVLIGFSGPIFGYRADTGTDPVSFIWMAPVSLVVNLAVGWLACRLLPNWAWLKWIPAAVMSVFVLALLTIWKPHQHIQLDDTTHAKCIRVLREGLRSDEFWPAMHAAEGLTIGGHGAEVREYLESMLAADNWDDQQLCGLSRELVRAGDPAREQIMLDILAGEDDFGHIHAVESLFKVGGLAERTQLERAFREGKTPPLRLMAAAALAKAGDDEAMSLLRESLTSNDEDTFRIAAWILARVGDKSDIEPIRARLSDASTPMNKAFLNHALAALGDKAGLDLLSKNLDSDDPDIRAHAATFAGDARAVSLAPKLIKQLNDLDLDARIRAAQSLLDLAKKADHKKN
ncbi:Sodium/glucose cotransporter [Rubinisphaera italica]|uniref:Sodium/glucose cotransporter n=2 Tax=Rubinisphaera italica TaxID=2527969 RepID=A0A5C5XEM4_9PLAN|nr:Sodium/glucose cotransporter [Rubinisphaera italica]